jgi:hypothetical protein
MKEVIEADLALWFRDAKTDWEALRGADTETLLSAAAPALTLLDHGGRYVGAPSSRILEWLDQEVVPVLRAMGERGQQLWLYLTDADSALNFNRVGALVMLFSLLLQTEPTTPSSIVGLVTLAIQLQSRREAEESDEDTSE